MKILLVEDEVTISGFVKKGLEENDFEVIQAFDGIMSWHNCFGVFSN